MSQYQPIECGQHSEYELAIMRGQSLELVWKTSDGNILKSIVKPVDIFTRQGEEFLLIMTDQKKVEIRLDQIESAAISSPNIA